MYWRDWSSDVCSSDLSQGAGPPLRIAFLVRSLVRPRLRRISMWIKRQAINFKSLILAQEKKFMPAKRREKTRSSLAVHSMTLFRVISRRFAVRSLLFCALALFALTFSSVNILAQQTTPTPAPPTTSPQTPPAGTSTQQQQQPTTPQPQPSQTPPNAPGSVVSPSNETQQSVQPQPGPQQQQQQTTPNTQGPLPPTPQTPGQPAPQSGLPTTANPVGTTPSQQTNQAVPSTGNAQTGVQ